MGTTWFRCGFILVCLLLVIPSFAQQTGAVSGTVTDASGAVVPGASVTLKDEGSGDERKSITNSEGFFNFASVQSGTYTVIVEMKGFKTFERKAIGMNLGDKRNITGIALEVQSSTTETVTVTSTVEEVSTVDSGEKAAVIGLKQLDNVQILGRNAAEFIKILPGMSIIGNGIQNQASYTGEVAGVSSGPVGSFSANGTRSGAMDVVADGAHVVDVGCNCGQAVNMNQEMMQEVKVLTSNFGADNQKGPVVITGITKAGTKDFHGEAYFYARNHIMNANDWYNNKTGVAPPQSAYYYPGGNIGGPVLIPGTHFNKNRDKLFFFLGYEYYNQALDGGTLRAFVPTSDMLSGNFSQSVLKAAVTTGAWYQVANSPSGFPGGMIPQSQFNNTGAGLMNLLPRPNKDPNVTGGYNFITGLLTYQNGYQLKPRVDWSISDNTKLYVTYSRQRESANRINGLWWTNADDVPYPSQLVSTNNSDSISANLTHIFNATLTNEFIFTFTNLDLPNSYKNPAAVDPSKLGMSYKQIFGTDPSALPEYTGWGGGVASMINPSGFQLTGSLYARKRLPTISDNLSKVWGTHTIKTGFYWEQAGNNQPSSNNANGQMVFASWGGGSSGNAYADTLLGRVAQYSETNKDVILAMAYHTPAVYVQDSWKVTRRFTLDYGIRFDHFGAWYDQSGTGLAIWDPTLYNPDPAAASQLTGIDWHKRDPKVPLSGTPSRFVFYSPRFGIAWDLFGTGKTVIRGGYGFYHFHDEQNVQAGALQITTGTYSYCACNGLTIPAIGNISPSSVIPGSITTLQKGDDRQPLTKTYSFTISQRLAWQSLFEVSYVGNESTDQNNWNTSFFNVNAIPLGGEWVTEKWTSGGDAPDYRPLKNYQAVNVARHILYQNYNGLQVSWNKQSGRFNWLANYTFSKALGIRLWSNEASNLNIRDNYGPLGYDRTHIFNLAYVYQMPNPIRNNKFVGGFVNGWQISGISQIQSGLDLQAAVNQNLSFGGYLQPGTLLPNGTTLTAPQGMNNENTLGTPDLQLMPVITCNPSSGLGNHQYVNGACFAPPTLGHNGSYEWPYIKGPAFFNHDLSVFKNFQIRESTKVQFRFSAYNFLNHPISSFLNGDPNLNLTFDKTGALSNQRFGYADEKFGHRILQLAIKFYF
jgi:hypothetical protein